MTTQTLTSIVIIAVLVTTVFITAFRLFKTFYLLKEVKTRLNLETEQKDHYKKKLASSPTRQEFIEQSEMATSWRQKHDKLLTENQKMESEIDRANEFITEARSIMERQRLVIEESHWDFDELAKFADHADKTGTISEYLKVSRRNVLRTPAPIHLFPNSFSTEPTQGIDHQIKSTEGEEKLTHNGLMKQFVEDRLNELEKQTEIDWSKPQPFPEYFEIPKGIKCKYIGKESSVDVESLPIGTDGVIIEKGHWPKFRFKSKGLLFDWFYIQDKNLAPLNPTDHPLHPDFNPSKYNDQ